MPVCFFLFTLRSATPTFLFNKTNTMTYASNARKSAKV